MLTKKPCPCTKRCPNRSAACHCDCNDYIEWDREHKEYNRLIRAEKYKQNGYYDLYAQEAKC